MVGRASLQSRHVPEDVSAASAPKAGMVGGTPRMASSAKPELKQSPQCNDMGGRAVTVILALVVKAGGNTVI
jgi:hypothetical protein